MTHSYGEHCMCVSKRAKHILNLIMIFIMIENIPIYSNRISIYFVNLTFFMKQTKNQKLEFRLLKSDIQ